MGSESLLTKFDEMVKRNYEQFTKQFKNEFDEMIGAERAKMKAEIEVYNAEKEKMRGIEVNDDDIVQLNVGGQKLATKRSTLCQVKDSLLASMFSGRWEDRLTRDKDGCIFLDYNPQHFSFILDWLRARKIETTETPAPWPNVPEDQLKTFNNLVEFLGLREKIVPGVPVDPIQLLEDDWPAMAVRVSNRRGIRVYPRNQR